MKRRRMSSSSPRARRTRQLLLKGRGSRLRLGAQALRLLSLWGTGSALVRTHLAFEVIFIGSTVAPYDRGDRKAD